MIFAAAPRSSRKLLLLASCFVAVLAAVALLVRPLMPIDETRYISVAWEMWLRGDFLVPFKNGAPYSHKPPLLMWLCQMGWSLFGVNEWWPRLVSPLVSVASLFLAARLARRLWPERDGIDGAAVLILASSLLWTIFSTSLMFDTLLAFFTLVGVHGTLTAVEGERGRGIAWLGVAIGLGVLTKGPVILLHLLPPALLAPWWAPGLKKARWFATVLLAILLGAAIALAWAIPAALAGGDEYARAIFIGQTANRVVDSFAHRRPLWWYLPLLPLLVLPWLFWPGLWRALGVSFRHNRDRGLRFCVAWALPVFVAFCLISGKQPHYLIPLCPAFALIAARAIADEDRVKGIWLPVLCVMLLGAALVALAAGMLRLPEAFAAVAAPSWPGLAVIAIALGLGWIGRRQAKPVVALALLGVAVSALLQCALLPPLYAAYDVRPMAQAIRKAQDAGHTVVHVAKDYDDQYQFAGRLQKPLLLASDAAEMKSALANDPNACALIYVRDPKAVAQVKAIAAHPYQESIALLLDAKTALDFVDKNGS
jgi:4-amino-4-deoxy-L-arabinose transferase-like glycosyltransferase